MKKIYYILLLFLIGFSSCEDYLDVEPYYSYSDANAVSDLVTAEYAVRSVYDGLRSDYISNSLYSELSSKSGFVSFYSDSYNLSYTEENDPGKNHWQYMYEAMNYVNFAIKGMQALPEESISSETEYKALLGEAKCARAYIYANLLWNFCHWWTYDDANIYGLAYRDQPADLENTQTARITIGESYAKIYEDLDYAIENMSDYTSGMYMSKQFAQALKAKLLLFRAGYDNGNSTTGTQNAADLTEALALVNDILTNAPGTFAMESDMQTLYDNSWDSNENLFCKYLEDGERDGGFTSYFMGRYGNRAYYATIEDITQTAGVVYGLDWFKEDPRWSIATGVAPYYTNSSTRCVYTFTKLYRIGRYQGQLAGEPYDKWTAYHFRYAELYILKAELLARTNASITEAIAPINEMRASRINPMADAAKYVADVDSLYQYRPNLCLPIELPATQDDLMDLIFKEYWLELCMENGSEFFASLRFYKDGVPYIEAIKDGLQLDEKSICWPIPSAEIENNQLIIQNEGLE
jgi:hypothetical protein